MVKSVRFLVGILKYVKVQKVLQRVPKNNGTMIRNSYAKPLF